jgi:D-glycero-alpha-D-manno-heptose-7-phosphate kinase
MILTSRTPLRISLFGGGTDYPEFFRRSPGAVLGFAIDKYIYISALPLGAFVDYRYRISYSRVEMTESVEQIRHPVVRAVLVDEDYRDPTDFSIQADLPASAGLGSSSAFTVGFQNVVNALRGRHMGKLDLARSAIRIEQERLQERVGVQDQLHAAFGGFNRFDFSGDDIAVTPVPLSADALADFSRWMLLIYTGRKRSASELLEEQLGHTAAGGIDTELEAMRGLVDEADEVIRSSPDAAAVAAGLAPLLAESWNLKKSLSSKISDPDIDGLYDEAISNGALAGKLCGAGGGGFLLVIVPPDRREGFLERMGRRRCVEFGIDDTGSTLLRAVSNGC